MQSRISAALASAITIALLSGSLGLPLAELPSLDALDEPADLLGLLHGPAPQDALVEPSALFGPVGPVLSTAAPNWASASSATIHPGVQMVTAGSQCTANFVFYDASNIYIGYAAHCAQASGGTSPQGCSETSQPLGTAVNIDGATRPGRLAYSAWDAMQSSGDTGNSNRCSYNDFALVWIDPADHGRVNPSVPFFGGPVGLHSGSIGLGESIFSYQNSGLRFGFEPLKPKEGISLGTGGNGWTHQTYSITPGIPGDSGSGLLSGDGYAAGALSTVAIAPITGSNNYSDLELALSYAQSHGLPGVTLAAGTEPFEGGLLF